jgi:hypothetical protein
VLDARAGVVGVAIAAVLALASTVRAETAAPGAPPRYLNIVRVKVRAGSTGSYEALEASIVRAFERARLNIYWIGLQSQKDAKEILYLNLFSSPEELDRATAAYNESAKLHPELTKLHQRLNELTVSSTTTLTSRRDEVEPTAGRPDFAAMRAVRVTIIQVKPGHEGDFITAVRTTKAKDRPWLVYESTDTSTFALVTLKRSPRSERTDGPSVPRSLRRYRQDATKADTHVYTVRPTMSHVPRAFAAANPQFWRPAPTAQ